MKTVFKNFVFIAFTIGLFHSTLISAAPLKNSKVFKDVVRQCEYEDGVTLRILASRECPTLETSPVINQSPNKASLPTTQSGNSIVNYQISNNKEDVILEKAIQRCTSIGFNRETAEFRTCVTDQIKILSK